VTQLPAELQGLVRGLHHVAIAVTSLVETRKLYDGILGLRALPVEFVPGQKVNVLVLFAGTQRIELVEPASQDSPITSFLAKRGPGLHHLAWRVDDVAAALAHARENGLQLIDQVPRPGSHGTTIAFLHPKSTGGVLMELVQDPSSVPH
jgi:methylmalonyl-CoA epimerase